jgi:hypothetical protein
MLGRAVRMYRVPRLGPRCPAVGAPLERGLAATLRSRCSVNGLSPPTIRTKTARPRRVEAHVQAGTVSEYIAEVLGTHRTRT